MSTRSVAQAHARARLAIVRAVAAAMRRAWQRMSGDDIDGSWERVRPGVLTVVTGGQLAAAQAAARYVPEVLAAQGIRPRPEALPVPSALAGVASDGRPLDTLLDQAPIAAKVALASGAVLDRAMATGYATLDMIAHTQVADAGRVADQVALVAEPAAEGYVRMLVGATSCSRCAVLAGKWFRWNAGFERHPNCDCVHIPAAEDTPETTSATDPMTYFNSLSEAEQDRIFTHAGAQAIRDGADMAQVVNARRGARSLATASRVTAAEVRVLRGGRTRGRLQAQQVFGQPLLTTTEGTTVRGLAGQRLGARESGERLPGARYRSARAPRLMPEQIYQIAGDDRDEALRLLRRNGYII